MRFDQRRFLQGQPVLDFAWQLLCSAHRQFFTDELRVNPDQCAELFDERLAIFDVFEGDIQAEARHVIGQQDAVAVEDEAARRLQDHRASAVVFGKVAIVRPLADLQVPQPQGQQRHDEQQSDPQHHQSALQFGKFRIL